MKNHEILKSIVSKIGHCAPFFRCIIIINASFYGSWVTEQREQGYYSLDNE